MWEIKCVENVHREEWPLRSAGFLFYFYLFILQPNGGMETGDSTLLQLELMALMSMPVSH